MTPNRKEDTVTTEKAVAKLTVNVYIDAKNLRHAEELLDHWLRGGEDDERLCSYVVSDEDWVPEMFVPETDE